jgi:hypothetical protein
MLDIAQRVFIEGFTLSKVIPGILDSSSIAGRHTSITVIDRYSKTPGVLKYMPRDHARRPWGQYLPPQCSSCGSTNSWSAAVTVGTSLVYTCKYREGTRACTRTISFSPPTNKYEKLGAWLAVKMD